MVRVSLLHPVRASFAATAEPGHRRCRLRLLLAVGWVTYQVSGRPWTPSHPGSAKQVEAAAADVDELGRKVAVLPMSIASARYSASSPTG